jgi:putative ABC transport system permease protein
MRMEHWFYTVPLRLRSLFRRRQVEQDLDEELRYHLDRKIEECVAKGMTPEEARYAALRAMDGLEQRKEECRDSRRVNGIANLLQDIRYGLRILGKSPAFTAVAVLTLALGIGANTAIFSVVNAVLLEPLPYPDAGRIVQIMLFSPAWAAGKNANTASVPEFIVVREQQEAFQEIAAYDSARGVNLTGADPPEQLRAIHVSADYFRLFGAPIAVGRVFTADEDRPGGPRLAVISDGLWRRRFGGDRGLMGKSILLGGEPYVVIGALGPGFAADPSAEILLPMQADPYSTNPAHSIRVAARLKPEVTLEIAKAQLKLAFEQFRRKFPNWSSANTSFGSFTAEPLWDATIGAVRRPLLVLAGAVSFVLLIACANVANLLMARATSRRREMAIRAALGASRPRIVSQLLVESVLLSLAGGALGLLLGCAGKRALLGIAPGDIPRIGSAATLDWRVLSFTLILSVGAGILFGVLPAFSGSSHMHAGAALQESGARTGGGLRQSRARSILVIAEMALALVLLAGAGLLIRTLHALRTVDPGFTAHNVLTMEMSLAGTPFQTAPAVAQLIRDAERRIESLPGVIALAATYSLPLESQLGGPVTIEGLPNDSYGASLCFVSHRYFDVFRIPLLGGRAFTERDDDRAPAVALINQAMADGRSEGMRWSSTFPWRKGDPLVERITIGKGLGPPFEDRSRQIIGVVGQVRDSGLNRNPLPMIYLPITQLTDGMTKMTSRVFPIRWAIHTLTEPYSIRAEVERELRAASGGLPVAHIRSMEQVVRESTARNRFHTILLSVFAGIALLLGAIGVYGLMAYTVQHRTQEIGIRLALGARPRDVRAMVIFEGMRLALIGVALGAGGALELTPLMASLLYGVQASDPAVLALVAILLLAVALLATYIPARRATRVDPVLALRWE